jgi:hypothetical protein
VPISVDFDFDGMTETMTLPEAERRLYVLSRQGYDYTKETSSDRIRFTVYTPEPKPRVVTFHCEVVAA